MSEKKKRGFAAMKPEVVQEIARMGGRAAHLPDESGTIRAHRFTSEEATAAGEKGGAATLAKYGNEHYQKMGSSGGKSAKAKRSDR
jgi:uncharacterized protein